jgi:hypothetical protein
VVAATPLELSPDGDGAQEGISEDEATLLSPDEAPEDARGAEPEDQPHDEPD